MGMTFQLKRTKVFILTHVQQAAIQIIWKACNSNALHNSSGGRVFKAFEIWNLQRLGICAPIQKANAPAVDRSKLL